MISFISMYTFSITVINFLSFSPEQNKSCFPLMGGLVSRVILTDERNLSYLTLLRIDTSKRTD